MSCAVKRSHEHLLFESGGASPMLPVGAFACGAAAAGAAGFGGMGSAGMGGFPPSSAGAGAAAGVSAERMEGAADMSGVAPLAGTPKRTRFGAESSPMVARRRTAPNPDTCFVPRSRRAPVESLVSPGRHRRKDAGLCLSCGENAVPPTFSLKQVQAMVARAVEEREAEVRGDFDTIVLEKLAEQYSQLSELNEANIRKQLSESMFSYMS